MKMLTTFALALGLGTAGAGALAAQQPAPPARMSMQRAQAIALARVPNNQGIKSTKLKTKDGVLVYEFDIETPGPGHQEVRVDARTGAVVANKHEDDLVGTVTSEIGKTVDRVFNGDEVEHMHPRISERRAREIARRQVPNAPIQDVDLETENGVLVWEIDLDTAGPGHAEVLVDANTGRVLRRTHEG